MTTLRMLVTYAIIVAALGLALSSSFVTGVYAQAQKTRAAPTLSQLPAPFHQVEVRVR